MSDTEKKEKPAFAEFWHYIKLSVNPGREKMGMNPIIRSEARKIYTTMSEFDKAWRRNP